MRRRSTAVQMQIKRWCFLHTWLWEWLWGRTGWGNSAGAVLCWNMQFHSNWGEWDGSARVLFGKKNEGRGGEVGLSKHPILIALKWRFFSFNHFLCCSRECQKFLVMPNASFDSTVLVIYFHGKFNLCVYVWHYIWVDPPASKLLRCLTLQGHVCRWSLAKAKCRHWWEG